MHGLEAKYPYYVTSFRVVLPPIPPPGVCPCTQLGDLRPSDRLPTSKSWLRHCSKIVTKYACNHVKCMLSLSCHYNTTPVTLRSAAHFLKCFLTLSMFEQFITQTTRKLFGFWMYWMMLSQFICCTETLWTFTANIRLHSFMSLSQKQPTGVTQKNMLR